MAITVITVPLDGSALGEAVLPYAVDLATRLNASIDLVTAVIARKEVSIRYGVVGGKDAVPESERTIDRGRSPSEMTADAAKAREYLGNVAARLQAQGVKVSRAVVTGPAASSIIERCAESESSLIAMATHGWTGIGHENVGSVTEAVLDGATIPAIVFRPLADATTASDATRISTLIVGLDGSPRAEGSLNFARMLARQLDVQIIVERSSGAALRFATLDAIEKAEEEDHDYIAGIVGRLKGSVREIEGVVRSGTPATDLAGLAGEQSGSLIVLTSQARSGRARWLMGSVADSVVRSGAAPVLVIPVAE